MKFKIFILLLISSFSIFGQDLNSCNKKLKVEFEKMQFYSNHKDEFKSAYDSIDKYSLSFEKLLIKYSKLNPKIITLGFKELTKIGLKVSTSQNGLFRIYSWDTETGGSMRGFRNVFQFKNTGKLVSLKIGSDSDDMGESDFTYQIIDEVVSDNNTFYVVDCIFIGSSALSVRKIKIFSIENSKLNENAKLIKTKSGIKNQISFEIDFSSSVNQTSDALDWEYAKILYYKKKQIIILPLILENGKLTKRKIKYKFNGKYFEKI